MFFFSGTRLSGAAEITSSAQGGAWNDPATWIGGQVPTKEDNVTIASVVHPNGALYGATRTYEVRNLTVTTSGRIMREPNTGGVATLKVGGTLLNYGELADAGNWFAITVDGTLVNHGIIRVWNIRMTGKRQTLSGNGIIEREFRLNMTDDTLTAASDLVFRHCILTSDVSTKEKKLDMGGYSLTLLADSVRYDSYYGEFNSSAELKIPLIFRNDGILRAEYSLLGGSISGNVKLITSTRLFLKDITFDGNVAMDAGSLISSRENLQKVVVKGDFSNFGRLNADTIRVRGTQVTPRTMNLYVYGNINNPGSTGITRILPVTGGKTIRLAGNFDGDLYLMQAEGSSKPGGKVLIDSEVTLSGRLDVYTGLEVAEGGTLHSLNRTLSTPVYVKPEEGSLVNLGTMKRYHRVGNAWSNRSFSGQPGMFAEYQVRDWSDRLEGVAVEVYNGVSYPGLPGTVKRWWRMTPEGSGTVKAFTLKLFYEDSLLNGQEEKNLKVFRSTDGGESWEAVTFGPYWILDTLQNTISIGQTDKDESMLHAFGDFVISSGDGSVPLPTPVVLQLTGSQGVRIGAPNRYTIGLSNVGKQRINSLLVALSLSDQVAFQRVEMPYAGGTDIYPIDSIGTVHDDIQLFYIPYLDGSEDYYFDVIVTGVDKGTKSTAADETQEVRALLLSGASGKEGVENFIADQINEPARMTQDEEAEYRRYLNLTDQQLKELKKNEKKGGTPAAATIKSMLELAARTNPVTKFVTKIGNAVEFISKIAPTYRRRMFLWFAQQTDPQQDKKIVEVAGKKQEAALRRSWDPNEKLGPAGYGESNFLASAGRMVYTIRFENKKEATAPAYRIQIVDTLSSVFNPATVQFLQTSPAGETYKWKMTRENNILKWDIEGIELPPNAFPPEGEGFVSFSVELNPGLTSGTVISNKASIVFDVNAPIITNNWTNVLDTKAPITSMNPVHYSTGDTVAVVSCIASDSGIGSGVRQYSFFVSENDQPFRLLTESYSNTISFSMPDKQKNHYRFYALSTDQVGNAETEIPAFAEITSIPLPASNSGSNQKSLLAYPNPVKGSFTLAFSTEKASRISLELYSATGMLIERWISGVYQPGSHRLVRNSYHLPQGVYFLKVTMENRTETVQLIRQ